MIKDDMGLPLVKYTYNEWGVCSMTAFNLENEENIIVNSNSLNAGVLDNAYYLQEEILIGIVIVAGLIIIGAIIASAVATGGQSLWELALAF